MSQEKSPITVCVRFRPRSSREVGLPCVQYTSQKQVTYLGADKDDCNEFSFDKIYQEDTSQAEVFNDMRHIVHAVLQGRNGTILTYGQTGSGKTHTLLGVMNNPEMHGIVPRAIKELAGGLQDAGTECSVRVSAIEIYRERICDLLDSSNVDLQVKQDSWYGIFVARATEISVKSEKELIDVMEAGIANRSVSATEMNAESSRSHCIVYVMVERTNADGTIQYGKLSMVDLAGSERQAKTGARGATLDEGILINKSLSALANVISSLTDGKNKHIPFRDSKLTRVLQDSLGGTSKTAMVVCCSPCKDNGPETLSSLRFGSRARGISNTVQVNTRASVATLEKMLQEARQECNKLNLELLKSSTLECTCACQISTTSVSAETPSSSKQALQTEDNNENIPQTKSYKLPQTYRFCIMLISLLVYFLFEDWCI